MALIRTNGKSSEYNPIVLTSVSSSVGFAAEIGKHYAIVATVGSSSATDIGFNGATVDAAISSTQFTGGRYFVRLVTATAATITASFVGTSEAGTLSPASID